MNQRIYGRYFILLSLIVLFFAVSAVFCQELPPSPVTAGDPNIPMENLDLILKPLTREELIVEADGWRDLLKKKVSEISMEQIRSKTAEDVEKETILKRISQLREERTGLIDRLNTVLKALLAKGGEIKVYEQYANAVSGIDIGREDAFSTWMAIQSWLFSKEGGIRWGTNIIKFILILVVFKILGNIIAGVTRRTLKKAKLSELLKDFVANTAQKIMIILGLMIALSMLEVNIGPLLAGLGVIGFVVGFALQNTLSNFAAGFMLLLYRPYDIGEVVNAGGAIGTVDSMNLVSTTIKTPDNQNVIVPNGKIWGDVITNITGNDIRRVDFVFGIGYDDDIAKAQSVLEQILSEHQKVLKSPAPLIKVHELADSSVNFICRPWARTSDYWDVYWDITRAVKERFDAEGISIPYPQQDVHIHQVTA
ncbi:MAG: mechanosensitive ion channel [Desulfobacterales bacterium]|nr:mechanosensitive ion channel [Desulfobacterales bacterium]